MADKVRQRWPSTSRKAPTLAAAAGSALFSALSTSLLAREMRKFAPLNHVLLQRTPRPTALVAIFHGLGGSLSELRPAAERWLSALPHTGFLLLEAPDRDYFERELKSKKFSGDWYRFAHPT